MGAPMSDMIVVPWHRDEEVDAFLSAWGITWDTKPEWLILQHDVNREGCAITKNKGIVKAVEHGADVVLVLDGDCYPVLTEEQEADERIGLPGLLADHVAALEPQEVMRFREVTYPPSRGTPYDERTMLMPVAASMGFWQEVGDYCAVRQLAFGARTEMRFNRRPIHGDYFPLCGMNLAFRPREWMPWCQFIDVPRFDDIWMGWLWQREAYRRGFCFNLAGPDIRHARQSNVWRNLRDETVHLEASETLWSKIAQHPQHDYESLRGLLPV
jgi:hypothetical protein